MPNANAVTGTREWSDHSLNIAIGCSHNCAYCYARSNALRFKKVVSDDEWIEERQKPNLGGADKRKYNGIVMFPTTHDITPALRDAAFIALRNLLGAGNRVLVVSKPHWDVIDALTKEFDAWKGGNLALRFSIGTLDDRIAKIWEPGAPDVEERVLALELATIRGFDAGVSMEPYLNADAIVEEFRRLKDLSSGTIWIGKMNHIRQRVGKRVPEEEIQRVEHGQRDDVVRGIYDALYRNRKVRWKDSIRAVVGVCTEGPIEGCYPGVIRGGV